MGSTSRILTLVTAGVVLLVAVALVPDQIGSRFFRDWRWDDPGLRQLMPFPRSIDARHGLDERVARRPEHIVAGSVLSAEVLLAIAPRERIAGVHYLAADPRYSMVADLAKGLRQVGADPEQLLAVRPDLVITDEFTKPETVALLTGIGVPVVRTHAFATFADVADNIRLIGWVTGCDEAAEGLVEQMRARQLSLDAHRRQVQDWRVMSLDGGLNSYGVGSLFDAEIAATGAANLSAERGVGPYRKLDIEAVLSWRPDALVLGVVPGEEDAARQRLLQYPGLKLLPCVQKNHVLFVPAALLGSTSQHTVEAAVFVQQQLLAWGKP